MKILVLKERGQGTVEYAFLLMIIAVAVIVMLALVHDQFIPKFVTHFIAATDPLGADPPAPETPEQLTNQIVELVRGAVVVTVLLTSVLWSIYAAMHMSGSDHKGRGKRK